MTLTRAEIALLEELNFNAWPALNTVHADGWLLRSSGGESRRVNSVNPILPGVLPLSEKIAAAEAVYARWGRDAIFRLTPLADPGLDEMLTARGYVVEAPTFVQIAAAEDCALDARLQLCGRPEKEWIAAALRIRGLTGEAGEVFALQHQAVGIDAGWALIADGDQPAGVGMVAIERGWAGLLGIYVANQVRRRGLARRISQGLLAYARRRGAKRAWLQVEQANLAALPLYADLGFRTAYKYHHRKRR